MTTFQEEGSFKARLSNFLQKVEYFLSALLSSPSHQYRVPSGIESFGVSNLNQRLIDFSLPKTAFDPTKT